MALNIKPGVLAQPCTFKRLASTETRQVPAGARVRYARNPANLGQFVLWHDKGMNWYCVIEANEIANVLQPKETAT